MDRFNQIINILENSKDPLASECLMKIRNETIHFSPGFYKDKNELASLYKLRLYNAQNLNRDKFRQEELASWSIAVNDLYNTDCKNVLLVTVNTEEKFYMIFVNADEETLASMFFLYQKTSLEDLKEYYSTVKEQGYSSSKLIYKQGKLESPPTSNKT